MPVIRGKPSAIKLPDAQRKSILERLAEERNGKTSPGGLVIFEIPLEQPDKLDVMVVWNEWEGLRSEDRTQLIQEAYKDKADVLALALGVTREEAIEQGVLPYRVRVRFEQQPKYTEEEVRKARLAVGGILGQGGSVDLRFPTRSIAEEAIQQLVEKLPGTQYAVQYVDD